MPGQGADVAPSAEVVADVTSAMNSDDIFLGIGIVLLLLYLAQLLWAAKSWPWRLRLHGLRRALVRALWRRRDDGPREGDGSIAEAVAKGVSARLEANIIISMPFLSSTGAAGIASICFNIVAKSPRWTSFGQTCVAITACSVLVLCATCPGRVLRGRPMVAYAFVMLEMCGLIFFAEPDPYSVFLTEVLAILFRVAMSLTYHWIPAVIFWNLVYLAFSCGACIGAFGDEPVAMKGMLLTQSCMTISILMLSYSAARTTEANVRREVESSVLRSEKSGLSNLLEMVCDVVVPLDANLRISSACSRFSALVTLQDRSVEGMRLQDYMPTAEDRDVFERFAKSAVSPAGSDMPHALHVRFRDGLGGSINAELFCVAFRNLVHSGYLVGIREWSDAAAKPLETTCFRCWQHRQRRSGERRSADRQADAGSEVGDSSDGDGATSSEGSPEPSPGGASGSGGDSTSEGLEPTSGPAVGMALARLLALCVLSSSRRRGGCCELHARIAIFREELKALNSLPCAPGLRPKSSAQCSWCGFLLDEGGGHHAGGSQCFVCKACAPVAGQIEAL